MQLTKQTDFAFRTLIYLAQQPRDRLVQIQQVSDFYGISASHVAKVVVKLAKLGYVEAIRGKGGGIRMQAALDEINLAEVVRQFEVTLNPANCSEPECRIVASCRLRGLLQDATTAFLASLAQYTLADLVDDGSGAARRDVLPVLQI